MILGTICCRGGSKGVPGKNIKDLLGKPLISYTIETAGLSSMIDETIVSTDSQEIVDIAKRYGANVPFIRPDDISNDTANKWDVFRHAILNYENHTGKHVDYLVDMDVTVPLKVKEDIDGIINFALEHPEADVVITAYEPERNPYFNMMEIGPDNYATIVKQSLKPIVRRQDAPVVLSLTPAAYVIKREAIFDYTHWSQAKCKLYEMPRSRAIDIDTAFDFKLVEFIMKQNEN